MLKTFPTYATIVVFYGNTEGSVFYAQKRTAQL